MTPTLRSLTTSADRDRDRRLAERHAVHSDRPLRLAAVAFAGWVVAEVFVSTHTGQHGVGQHLVRSLAASAPTVLAVVLTVVAARRATGRDRTFWTAVGSWSALTLAADAVALVGAGSGHVPVTAGWAISALHLGGIVPLLVAALFVGGRPRFPNGRGGIVDGVTVGVGSGLVGWHLGVVPALAAHVPGWVLLYAAAPLAGSIAVVVVLAAGVGSRRDVPISRVLITVAIAVSVVVDVIGSHVGVVGTDNPVVHAGWGIRAGLLGVAAFAALRHREIEGRPRTLPSAWPTIAVLIVSVNLAQIVVSDTRAHTAGAFEVVVAVFVVGSLLVRGLVSNQALRRTALGLERARAEQERLAVTDGLTSLYNRRFFEEFLRLEASRSLRRGSPLSLVVADLDHFKRINDEHGHRAGDEVLVEVARRLGGGVRDSDVVARYGGEEFALVLPETEPGAALEVAERCRQLVGDTPIGLDPERPGGARRDLAVTGSFGVATLWSVGDVAVDDLVRAADRALYRAKAAGRNRVTAAGEWDFSGPVVEPGTPAEDDPVVAALLRAAELVDADQGPDEHAAAMARWAGVLADHLGLDARTHGRAVLASRLHDVGKLSIPRSVLAKPGALTDQEWALVRTHPEQSEVLVGLSPRIEDLGPAVRAHHERFDGGGYPDGLAGHAIPVEARIVAVCDAWAAMRARRVYADARPVEDCRRELTAGRGRQFDPAIADLFLTLQVEGLVGDLGAPRTPALRRRDTARHPEPGAGSPAASVSVTSDDRT